MSDLERARDTITSLCDRIDRICNIAHDTSKSAEDRIREIQEWSEGFAQLTAQGEITDE